MLTRGDIVIKSVCTADLLNLGKAGLARWYRRRAERPHIIRSRSASTAIRWHVSIPGADIGRARLKFIFGLFKRPM